MSKVKRETVSGHMDENTTYLQVNNKAYQIYVSNFGCIKTDSLELALSFNKHIELVFYNWSEQP